MILRRRSRPVNDAGAQRSHVSDQLAILQPTVPRADNGGNAGGKGASTTARALFASPRLSHSSSLPAGSIFGAENPAPDAEAETTGFSMSPTSVLDAAAAFASGPSDDGSGTRRRPWREGLHGLADALDCAEEQRRPPSLVRSCSLDRRVEFGVKNRSSWLPAAAASSEPRDTEVMMEPSSEDYTCVICRRGPNPRTVHIFGDRVVEGGAESAPWPISLPARGEGAFLSL